MLRRIAKRIWQVIREEFESARTKVWLRNRNLVWPATK